MQGLSADDSSDEDGTEITNNEYAPGRNDVCDLLNTVLAISSDSNVSSEAQDDVDKAPFLTLKLSTSRLFGSTMELLTVLPHDPIALYFVSNESKGAVEKAMFLCTDK